MKNFTLLMVLCATLFTARLVAQPTMSATAPTRPAADVISLFSGAYTDLAGTSFFPNWGQATVVSDFTIVGTTDVTKKYMNLDYQGTEFTSQNVSTYSALHLDVWTAVVTSFKIFPINPGAAEQGIVKTTVAGWNSFDISIADFKALGLPMTNVIQFKIQDDPYLGQGTGTKTLYFDNIYFWKSSNVPTITGFTVPAKVVGAAPFTLTAPTSNSSGAFTYSSDNMSVATISGNTVTVVGAGMANITANQAAAGAYVAGSTSAVLTVTSPGPQTAAPTPTKLAANVTSLYSNAYTNVGIDTWSAVWDVADVADVTIAGNATKKYTNHTYSGIEFTGLNMINATSKTHIHMDVWTADAAGADGFKVKLVDFGANGVYDGGDDANSIELPFTPTASGWFAIDAPLSSFTGLTTKANLAQMVLVTPGGNKTFWLDNVYLYNEPVAVGPMVAAPTPTKLAANVTSLYSNAYTNVGIDTWSAVWDVADVADVTIAGNATKKYTNHTYSGIEFTGLNMINATSKTHIHMDVWTADAAGADGFKVKLVDFGANGVYDGGDDANSIELPFTPTASGWFAIDAPLSSFTGLTTKANLAQMVLVTPGGNKTFWLDNVYLYNNPVVGPTAPTTAAPTPIRPASGVISVFSNAYTDLTGTDFFPNWSQSTVVSDVMIAGNATKKYATFNYQGTQFATPINASTMQFLHIDYWSSTMNSFDIFLVNIAPLAQTEQKVTVAPTLSGWNSFDIPLSSYNLINKSGIGQFKLEGRPSGGDAYLDNIYFYTTVIPVEMTYFKAKTANNTSVLTWQTASESNNQGFTVERGNNGTTFSAIGNVKGNGTTSAVNNYTFTDLTPLNGVNYYRLRQADFNGKESISKTVSLVFGKNTLAIKNTLVEQTLEVIVSEAEKTPLSIFNISGQLVFSATVQGTQVLDVSNLTAGMYIVRMGTGEARRFVKH